MLERRRYARTDVDLGGTIRFRETDHTVKCIIRNISAELTGAMIVMSDPYDHVKGDVDLSISISIDEPPVTCAGKIVWYSEEEGPFSGAGVFINDISQTDQEKLAFVVTGSSPSSSDS